MRRGTERSLSSEPRCRCASIILIGTLSIIVTTLSLGEAYMEVGNKKLAIEHYEKSLELDADNKNAEEMLKKLRQSRETHQDSVPG